MYSSGYTESISEALIESANRLMLYSPSSTDIAEVLLHSVVLLCEGTGGFIDLNQQGMYFDITVGYARNNIDEIREELIKENLPEPGQVETCGKFLLFSTRHMLIGVIEPRRYVDKSLIQNLVTLAVNSIQKSVKYNNVQKSIRIDALTSILNRKAFDDDLNSKIVNFVNTYERPVTFMYIDLNNFKSVNDTLGHDMGDRVLCAMAQNISKFTKGIGNVYRLGGDEFCVVVLGKTAKECEPYARRIQGLVHHAPGGIEVTASIGLATCLYVDDIHKVIKKAEAEMYDMKLKERRKSPRKGMASIQMKLDFNNGKGAEVLETSV